MSFAEETPTPSRRSIPPISVAPQSEASTSQGGSGWVWVIGSLWLAAMIPLGLQWSSHSAAAAAAGESSEPPSAFVPVGFTERGQVTVPESAVTEVEGKPTVFVMERDLHLLVATPVVLGEHQGAARQVLSGVSRGQFVVTDALSTQRALAAR